MLSRKHVEQEGVAVVVHADDAIDAEVHAVVFDDDVAGVEEVVDVKVLICRPHPLTEEYLPERCQLAKALHVLPNFQIFRNHAATLMQRTAALGPALLPNSCSADTVSILRKDGKLRHAARYAEWRSSGDHEAMSTTSWSEKLKALRASQGAKPSLWSIDHFFFLC